MTLAPGSVERLCSGESYVRPVADTGVWFGFHPRSDVLEPGGCRLTSSPSSRVEISPAFSTVSTWTSGSSSRGALSSPASSIGIGTTKRTTRLDLHDHLHVGSSTVAGYSMERSR
jgi:hypothetical protein